MRDPMVPAPSTAIRRSVLINGSGNLTVLSMSPSTECSRNFGRVGRPRQFPPGREQCDMLKPMENQVDFSRRAFMTALVAAPAAMPALAESDRLNVAWIGTG